MEKVTSKLFCVKPKGGQSSPLSLSLLKRHTWSVPGRKELSSDVGGMPGLWFLVQVSCSSITAAARDMRLTGKKYRLRALKPFCMWWVDPGWTPGAHQSHSITHLLSWTGERKHNERFMGQDKDRERSLTNYCHRQNRLDLGNKI